MPELPEVETIVRDFKKNPAPNSGGWVCWCLDRF